MTSYSIFGILGQRTSIFFVASKRGVPLQPLTKGKRIMLANTRKGNLWMIVTSWHCVLICAIFDRTFIKVRFHRHTLLEHFG